MQNSTHKSLAIQDQKNTIFDKFVLTCILDLDFNMIDASRAFIEFLGYEQLSIARGRYKFFQTKELNTPFVIEAKQSLKLGHIFKGEIKNTNQNSQEFYLDATISPINDENEQFSSHIFCNITSP